MTGWQEFQNSKFSRTWKLEVETIGKEQAVVEAITQGTALAVSDGSFKEGRGAAAWTIEGRMANNKITGACLVPGTAEDHSAFRSELMGILGVLLTAHHILMDYSQVQGTLQVCCDGKSALSLAASDYPILITEPHADLLSAIRKVRDGLKCRIVFKHVRGHQDSGLATVLERDATLNVEMDARAKEKIEDTAGPATYEIPFESWTCYIGRTKVIKQWQLTLREHINGKPICNYWQGKKWFGSGVAAQVDWASVRQATSEVGWSRRKWVMKYTTGEFAHGENMHCWHFRTVSKCPRCSQEKEGKDHIL